MKKKWVTNIYNPTANNARMFSPASNDKEWDEWLLWVAKFTKGQPKASKLYSVDQLKKMDMIGLYK